MKDSKEKQHEINAQLQEHTIADEEYHITASTVFSLANRALEIFESSEVDEKRQLLNYLLQNCRLSGKKLEFDLRSPFNLILKTAHKPIGLPIRVQYLLLQDPIRVFEDSKRSKMDADGSVEVNKNETNETVL